MVPIKIAVIGSEGFVGKQMVEFFGDVVSYDIHDVGYREAIVNKCDLAVICLPTPMNENGSCDTSLVEEAVKWIETKYILIKSTVTPGTTDKLKRQYEKRIVFSPEHSGESKYYHSFWKTVVETPFFIFGGEREDIRPILDEYIKRAGPEKKYIQTTPRAAEMSKYLVNATLATRVAQATEFSNLCEESGLDWNEMRELWLLDPRMSSTHTCVFRDNPGFGGKCLPKDLEGIIWYARMNDTDTPLLEAVKKYKQ